ncbi:hypothetical protein [Methanoplanus endosymbiosus]|uniref:Uncharacterized protein n=1 Tax=Methanoplanus endosymbiosus TaxID=33865 RepID=A0A9E7PLU9_9EURY|nr:hypothetical protein [Methanoplanus endosymbiosus]UUX92558.1 hypothetical protein L6E24_00065 [Methanoplanus endosymbiosus]
MGNRSLHPCGKLRQILYLSVLIFAVIPLSYFKDDEESGRDEICNRKAHSREYGYAAESREYIHRISNSEYCYKTSPEGYLSDGSDSKKIRINHPEIPSGTKPEIRVPVSGDKIKILDITDGYIRLINGNITINLTQYRADGEEKLSDKLLIYYSSGTGQENLNSPKLTLGGSGIDLSDYNYHISIFSNCRQMENYTILNYDSKKTFHLDGCLDSSPDTENHPDPYPVKPAEGQLGLCDLIIRKGEKITFRVNAELDNNFRIPKGMSVKVRLYLNSGEEYIDSESQCLNDNLPQDFILTYRPKDYKEIYCIIPVVYAEKTAN